MGKKCSSVAFALMEKDALALVGKNKLLFYSSSSIVLFVFKKWFFVGNFEVGILGKCKIPAK